MKAEKIIKIVLASLFFMCLLDMPFGFYQLVRFLALIGFAYLSYKHFERDQSNIAFIYTALALLFQPFFKIALGRDLWNIVDVVVGLGLLVSIFIVGTKKITGKQEMK